MRSHICTATAMVLAGCLMLSPASYGAETVWIDHDDYARSRLIAASEPDANGGRLFGWEIELQPGWKTYWRTPGEAGLPVDISIGGDMVDIQYPVPSRFDFFGIESYGYGGHLVLPFSLAGGTLTDRNVNVSFMICKDICIPMSADFSASSLNVADATPAADVRLAAWVKKVPQPSNTASELSVADVQVVGAPGRQRVIVDIASTDSLAKLDIFVEAEGSKGFAQPDIRLRGNGQTARAVVPAIMKPGDDLTGKALRITVADGRGRAIDHRWMPAAR